MSSLELIRSIFSTFPIVMNLLRFHKDSEIGQDWDLLLQCLKTEELIFLECIQNLIAANVEDANLHLSSSKTLENDIFWKDKTLESAILKGLGQEKAYSFLLTLSNIENLIKVLHEDFLSHDGTSEEGRELRDSKKPFLTREDKIAKFHEELLKLRDYNACLGKLVLRDEKLEIPTDDLPLSGSSNPAPTALQQQQPAYEYQRLDFDTHEIRLLLVDWAEDEEAPLMCSLEHVSLIEPGPYAALSYCWGDQRKKTSMQITSANGQDYFTMEITVNLNAALHAVRRYLRDKWTEWSTETSLRLWVDAICINQSDSIERSLQIRNMRQIYTEAQEVIAWVGPLEDERLSDEYLLHLPSANLWCSLLANESDNSAETIQRILKDLPVTRKKELQAFNAFFGFSYWTRVWIIQEITVSTAVRILYGDLDFLWEDLVKVISVLETAASQYQILDGYSFQGSMHLFKFYEHSLIKRRPISLLEALSWSRRTHATDPRDKIFALLGLCYDGPTFVPLPNYKQPLESIVVDMSRKMIQLNRSLDIVALRGIGARKGKSSLPTWAADWPTMWEGNITLQEDHVLQAPSSCKINPVLEDSNRLLLKVNGRLYCTVINTTTAMWPYFYTMSGEGSQQNATSNKNIDVTPCTIDVAFRDEIWQTLTISEKGLSRPTFGSKWFSQLWLPEGRASIQNTALIDWLDENAGFEIRGHSLLQWSQMSETDEHESAEEDKAQFSQIKLTLNKALEDILGSGMKLACLERGGQVGMGMVHPNVQEADEIFDLNGCSIPLVLRMKASGSGGNSYSVVGGAWMNRIFESTSKTGTKSDFQTLVLI